MEWYKDANDELRTACNADFVRALLRLCPKKFGEDVIAEALDKQAIPSWAGFNAILYPEMPIVNNIGYCPMVDGSSNDYSTIYTVLKHAQKISATVGQADTVITFDLAIYSKAKEIQWRFPDEFSNVLVRMGGFHIALNFLSLLGKKFADSGLEDLLIESGVYAAGSTSALMKGKSYNRGIRAHKLCLEVFFRLVGCISSLVWVTGYEDRRRTRTTQDYGVCSFGGEEGECAGVCEKDRSRSDGTDIPIRGL